MKYVTNEEVLRKIEIKKNDILEKMTAEISKTPSEKREHSQRVVKTKEADEYIK